jgi:hypothetical protein
MWQNNINSINILNKFWTTSQKLETSNLWTKKL